MVSAQEHQRPPYPAVSTSSSAFQNSSNSINSAHSASSYGSASIMPASLGRQDHYHAAPLPSPTLEQEPFFGSMSHPVTQNQQSEAMCQQQHQQQVAAQQMAALQQYQQYQQQQAYSDQQQAYQQQQQAYQNQQQAYQNQQQAYQNQQHAQGNYTYQPNRQGSGSTAGETNAYINNYALIAEAAKRAQMAVLERDFGGVDLS